MSQNAKLEKNNSNNVRFSINEVTLLEGRGKWFCDNNMKLLWLIWWLDVLKGHTYSILFEQCLSEYVASLKIIQFYKEDNVLPIVSDWACCSPHCWTSISPDRLQNNSVQARLSDPDRNCGTLSSPDSGRTSLLQNDSINQSNLVGFGSL